MIGFGGKARRPERMFCISLKEAKYPAPSTELVEKFKRNSKKKFFWKNGILK
ncbi:hypothetical protein MSBRW_3114 [Methanosarcina barkeri str. Wiesmoor]|uniref:Uncharacterized protein n=1 Tax=Methanosarcina barkeri str. Wiesmoor TaxID=1434109 RepID=A0A0E3QQI2_METBA|nr:hypothetical protein MSBRW_3114 [Methanosarcina barkeri str. Wiesmoor]